MFKNSAENVLIPCMTPEALNFRSHFHDCFFREPMKVRKDTTTGAIVCRDGPLIKSAMEQLEVLAGFYAINEYFQHCLVMLLKSVN